MTAEPPFDLLPSSYVCVSSMELLNFRPKSNGNPSPLRGLSITVQGSGNEDGQRVMSAPRSFLRPRVLSRSELPKAPSARVCLLPQEEPQHNPRPVAQMRITTLKQLISEQRVESIEWYQQFACESPAADSSTTSPSIWINGHQLVTKKTEDAGKVCALLTDLSTTPHVKRARGIEVSSSSSSSSSCQGIVRLRLSGSSASPLEPPRPQLHSLVQLHLTTLCDVHIRRVDIADEEFTSLMVELQNCSHLQSLDLTGSLCFETKSDHRAQRVKQLADFLDTTTTLERLNIGENRLHKELFSDLFAALGHNTSIVHLNLWGNDLSKPRTVRMLDVALMKRSTRLRALNLHMTGLSDSGLELFSWLHSSLCSLHTLALSNNELSELSRDSLIRTVSNNAHLTRLTLSGNHLSDDCLAALSPYLKIAPRLCRVALHSDSVVDQGLLDEVDRFLAAKAARLSHFSTLFGQCWRVVVTFLDEEDVVALRAHFNVAFDQYCSSAQCRWPQSRHAQVVWTDNVPLCIYCALPGSDSPQLSSPGRKQRRTKARTSAGRGGGQEPVVVLTDDDKEEVDSGERPDVVPEPEPRKPRPRRSTAQPKKQVGCPFKKCSAAFDSIESRENHIRELHPDFWVVWVRSGLVSSL